MYIGVCSSFVYLVGCVTSNHYTVVNYVTIMPKSENRFYLEAKTMRKGYLAGPHIRRSIFNRVAMHSIIVYGVFNSNVVNFIVEIRIRWPWGREA